MTLKYTPDLTRALAIQIDQWPDLWPSGPGLAIRAHQFFMARLNGSVPPADDPTFLIHTAVDEWLLSTDRDLLTDRQRAICGCALLEVFAVPSSIARGVPNIEVALLNIAPDVRTWPEHALSLLLQIVRQLQSSPVDLDEWEAALLTLAAYCIMLRMSSATAELAPATRALATIQRDKDDSDDSYCRPLAASMLAIDALPLQLRHMLKGCT